MPHVETPHVHRPPQQNQGAPYIDPTSEHPDAGMAPRAHLDRLAKIDPPEIDFKKLTKAINKGVKGMPVGRKLKSAAEGHDLLRRLSQGDVLALDDLGLKNVPKDFHAAGREWALVEGRNGFYIYAGRYADLEIPSGARIHAHNHPDPKASAPAGDRQPTIDLPVSYEGKTFVELMDGADGSRNLLKSGLSPSIADIHAISDGGAHVIYTRYVHRGNGKIANPVAGELASPVEIHLAGAKVARYNPRLLRYYYQVSVELRDASGQRLWSGEMYGHWYARAQMGNVHHVRPNALNNPAPEGWVQP